MATPTAAEVARSPHHGQRMPLADYEALPEEKPYLEYWDGVVLQKAVPRRKHRRLQAKLAINLGLYWEAHGGDCGPEGHVWFAGHGYLVPDLAYWLPTKDSGDDRRSLPPTLAIEIRSPGETMAGQRQKCRTMRANGVDVCWLIDPEARTVERFEGEDDGEPFASGGALESPLLPGFSLPLAQLFAVLGEPPASPR